MRTDTDTVPADISWIESDRELHHASFRHVSPSCDDCVECDAWEGVWVDRLADELGQAVQVPIPSFTEFIANATSQPVRIVDSTGAERWHRNGVLHRTDGPAITHVDGSTEWFSDGRRHRTDGPAISYPDGTERWYRNGRLHRTDGPAVTHADGSHEWYLDGVLQSATGDAWPVA